MPNGSDGEDWLRAAVEQELVVERGTWASERLDRVAAALQANVPKASRLEAIAVWLDGHNAFTASGRTIYIGRRLLECLPTDDAAAFVVAHELAHHQLGHVPRLPRGLRAVPLLVLHAVLARWIHGHRRERDADLRAIELCTAAGYDPALCLVAFERLEQVVFDHGHVDGVLGPEHGEPTGSHPPVRARADAVRAHLAAMATGHRLTDELRSRRDQRRRRLLAAGSAAAAVALFVLARRVPR